MISKTIYPIFLLLSFTIYSQKNEIGIFVGGSNYIGDIGSTMYINPSSYAIGFMYRKNFNKRISARAKVNYVNIKGDDSKSSDNWRLSRGKYFENTILDFGLGIDFNFLDFDLAESSFQMSPYFSTGISYISFDNYDDGSTTSLSENKNIAIPITLGYKIKPNNNLIFAIEVTANHSFTDNIDGSDDLSIGSGLSNDWYVYSGITITYIFGKKICCRNY
jgi:hypothetical protein